MVNQDHEAQFIDVSDLRIGHYVYLDLGWMRHPFALNNFRITGQEQIDTIRQLGINRIRWSPERSVPEPTRVAAPADAAAAGKAAEQAAASEAQRRQRRELLDDQRKRLESCERQFTSASRTYRQVIDIAQAQPEAARLQTEQVIDQMVNQLIGQEETAIRLLSENFGEKSSLHAVNVTTLSLLLGKTLGLDAKQLGELGMGALLHDIGKIVLPERLRWKDDKFNSAERHLYEEHVAQGAEIARAMRLPAAAQTVIAQHHELANGRGYPRKLAGEAIALPARIVSLVNHYDNLCNPANPTQAVTPHEALSLTFAQAKHQFDIDVLMPFIRMMGVYPPGSVIELNDGRFALVVSVNSSRPLRPHILIHDARVPRDEALIVDLEAMPQLGIRRSLKPLQLPRATFDYLSPRTRICYFFERAQPVGRQGEGEA